MIYTARGVSNSDLGLYANGQQVQRKSNMTLLDRVLYRYFNGITIKTYKQKEILTMTYTAHEVLGGYYETHKQVEVSARLRYMPYAQAGWRRDGDNYFTMISYSSRIFTAQITAFGVEEISVRDADAAINYSRTTSRQVTAAMREIGLTDSTIARLKKWFTSDSKHVIAVYIGHGEWMDADTGEAVA